MGFDATKLMEQMADSLERHADRDGLSGIERGVFLARGGHAPGAVCPTAEPAALVHYQACGWFMGDECDLGCRAADGGGGES